MARPIVQNPRVELSVTKSSDEDLHSLVARIKQAATTSKLFQGSQLLQTGFAALLVQDAAFTQASADVDADRAKLDVDIATETTSRNDLRVGLRVFAAIAERDARSPAELQGLGFVSRDPPARSTVQPTVPTAIDITFPATGGGKAWVSVRDNGSRQQYVAQWSLDPYGPTTWAQLGTGHGKRRLVTGASGAKVWVRFAAVRGQLQSDWSTPVLVTLP